MDVRSTNQLDYAQFSIFSSTTTATATLAFRRKKDFLDKFIMIILMIYIFFPRIKVHIKSATQKYQGVNASCGYNVYSTLHLSQ